MPLMAPKPLPPRWMRRVVLAPAVVALTVTLLLTLPVWRIVAAAASPLLPGRLRGLRVLWVVIVWLVLESACLMALFGLWLASGFGVLTRTPPFQRVHYRLVGGYLWVFHRAATRVLGLRVEVEGPAPDEYLGRPLLVFRRHAGRVTRSCSCTRWSTGTPGSRGSCWPLRCSGTRRSTSCSTACRTGSCPPAVPPSSSRSGRWRPRSTTTTPS
jgi:hypothetical protein